MSLETQNYSESYFNALLQSLRNLDGISLTLIFIFVPTLNVNKFCKIQKCVARQRVYSVNDPPCEGYHFHKMLLGG